MSDYNKVVFDDLPNGIRCYSLTSSVLNAALIGIHRGTRDDPPQFEGAHHLIEHMFCGCSKTIPGRQVCRINRRHLGGSNGDDINVFTVASHTAYGNHDLPYRNSLHQVFLAYAALIRDNMYELHSIRRSADAILNDDIYTLERAAVANETCENDDYPATAAFKAALPLLYTKNPAGRYGDSNLAQLEKVKLGSLKQWGMGSYVPANMSVILIGPRQPRAMKWVREAQLDQLPDDWKTGHSRYDHSDDVPVLEGIREKIIEKPGLQMHYVQMLWPTEVFLSDNWITLQVLASVLKDRIEEELRDNNRNLRGGVYHPHVSWDASDSNGYLDVSFATRGDWAHTQDLMQRVLQVCDRLKNDTSGTLREDVFDSRKQATEAHLTMYRYLSGHLAERILHHAANGDANLEHFEFFRKGIQQVTAQQVRDVAAKYLITDRFVRVVIRPVL